MRTVKVSDLTTDDSIYGHGKAYDAIAEAYDIPPAWRAEIESVTHDTTRENYTDIEVSVNFSGETYTEIITVPSFVEFDILDR